MYSDKTVEGAPPENAFKQLKGSSETPCERNKNLFSIPSKLLFLP